MSIKMFVKDFTKVWSKVTNLDRFGLKFKR